MDVRSILFEDFGFIDRRRQPWRSKALAAMIDPVFDLRSRLAGIDGYLAEHAQSVSPKRVLVVGIRVPSRPEMIDQVMAGLESAHHHIERVVIEMGRRSKFENVNLAITDQNLDAYDYVVVTDDDIDAGRDFLDRYLLIVDRLGFQISQPAHRFDSYATFRVTQRDWGTVARQTGYVEIGPITVFSRDVVAALLPFPTECGMGWGLDLHWSGLAARNGWRIGVVDAVSIRHLRPVAATYDRTAAIEEAVNLLRDRPVSNKREAMRTVRAFRLTDLVAGAAIAHNRS